MKTTAKDLRNKCGRPHAKIVPIEFGKRTKRTKGKDALFGIWKENPKVCNVEAYIDSLRSGRF